MTKKYMNTNTGEIFTLKELKSIYRQFKHEMTFKNFDDFKNTFEVINWTTKTEDYKNRLDDHITFSYWDYLYTNEVQELRKENKNAAKIPGCNYRATYRIEGNKAICTSYYTDVFSYNFSTGEIEKLWEGYSKTTLKHVNAFCDLFNLGISFDKHSWVMF